MNKLRNASTTAGPDPTAIVDPVYNTQVYRVQVDEALVEQIWQEIEGKASRVQIRQWIAEATGEFAEATIRTYVPILIRRQVRKNLAKMLNDVESQATVTR